MARPKYTEVEARDMVKKELLWRKPIKFPRPGGGYYGDSDSEDGTTSSEPESTNNAEEDENRPCYLLKTLPVEIRKMIYRILFVRPTAIVPGPIRYKCSIGWRNKPVVPIYSYQWNDRRQNGHEEWGLPKYDGSYGGLQISWRSKPTIEQSRFIEAGIFKTNSMNSEQQLPGTTYNEDLEADVGHYICRRGTYPVQVISRAVVNIAGIQGIALMGTCKQILAECRLVFYGENTFVFDTRGQDPYTHHRGVHAHDAFERYPQQVPGLPREDGSVSHRNTERAITHMFDKDARHQPFMSRDPLTKFFRHVGRENASSITKVIIEGFFRTAEENERYKHNRPIGFGRILPIHATILKNVCPNLRKLTLHQGYNNSLWDDDVDGETGLSDEDRVDQVVGQVVNMLPSLQELHLGNYHFVPSGETILEEWGRSLRWEQVVQTRHRQRADRLAAEDRRKKNAAAMKELQQYIWKEDRSTRARGGRSGNAQSSEKKPAAASLRPDAFASLIDQAMAKAGLEDGADDNGGNGKAAARPSFRKGKKGKRAGAKESED